MNLERVDFRIEDFSVMQMHQLTNKYVWSYSRTKRYFRAIHDDSPSEKCRIIAYVDKLVETEVLLEHLKTIKEINHPLIGNIVRIIQTTTLIDQNGQNQTEDIIGVVLEDFDDNNYVSFYDFITHAGPLTENLTKDLILKILELIRFLNEKNLQNLFYPQDIYIDKKTAEIRIDCCGDRRYFKLKEDYISDLWQLGFFAFTCLKSIPPYNRKSSSDLHYSCLVKGNHNKFWAQINRKQKQQQNMTEFINILLSVTNKTFNEVTEHPWLKTHKKMTTQEKIHSIKQIIQEREYLLIKRQQQKRKRKQAVLKAVEERNLSNQKRGHYSDEFIQAFIEKLQEEENMERQLQNNGKLSDIFLTFNKANPLIGISYIWTLLSCNLDQNVQIKNLKEDKNLIEFKIKAEIDKIYSLENKVELELIRDKEEVGLRLKNVNGSQFEGQWIHNYLQQLLVAY